MSRSSSNPYSRTSSGNNRSSTPAALTLIQPFVDTAGKRRSSSSLGGGVGRVGRDSSSRTPSVPQLLGPGGRAQSRTTSTSSSGFTDTTRGTASVMSIFNRTTDPTTTSVMTPNLECTVLTSGTGKVVGTRLDFTIHAFPHCIDVSSLLVHYVAVRADPQAPPHTRTLWREILQSASALSQKACTITFSATGTHLAGRCSFTLQPTLDANDLVDNNNPGGGTRKQKNMGISGAGLVPFTAKHEAKGLTQVHSVYDVAYVVLDLKAGVPATPVTMYRWVPVLQQIEKPPHNVEESYFDLGLRGTKNAGPASAKDALAAEQAKRRKETRLRVQQRAHMNAEHLNMLSQVDREFAGPQPQLLAPVGGDNGRENPFVFSTTAPTPQHRRNPGGHQEEPGSTTPTDTDSGTISGMVSRRESGAAPDGLDETIRCVDDDGHVVRGPREQEQPTTLQLSDFSPANQDGSVMMSVTPSGDQREHHQIAPPVGSVRWSPLRGQRYNVLHCGHEAATTLGGKHLISQLAQQYHKYLMGIAATLGKVCPLKASKLTIPITVEEGMSSLQCGNFIMFLDECHRMVDMHRQTIATMTKNKAQMQRKSFQALTPQEAINALILMCGSDVQQVGEGSSKVSPIKQYAGDETLAEMSNDLPYSSKGPWHVDWYAFLLLALIEKPMWPALLKIMRRQRQLMGVSRVFGDGLDSLPRRPSKRQDLEQAEELHRLLCRCATVSMVADASAPGNHGGGLAGDNGGSAEIVDKVSAFYHVPVSASVATGGNMGGAFSTRRRSSAREASSALSTPARERAPSVALTGTSAMEMSTAGGGGPCLERRNWTEGSQHWIDICSIPKGTVHIFHPTPARVAWCMFPHVIQETVSGIVGVGLPLLVTRKKAANHLRQLALAIRLEEETRGNTSFKFFRRMRTYAKMMLDLKRRRSLIAGAFERRFTGLTLQRFYGRWIRFSLQAAMARDQKNTFDRLFAETSYVLYQNAFKKWYMWPLRNKSDKLHSQSSKLTRKKFFSKWLLYPAKCREGNAIPCLLRRVQATLIKNRADVWRAAAHGRVYSRRYVMADELAQEMAMHLLRRTFRRLGAMVWPTVWKNRRRKLYTTNVARLTEVTTKMLCERRMRLWRTYYLQCDRQRFIHNNLRRLRHASHEGLRTYAFRKWIKFAPLAPSLRKARAQRARTAAQLAKTNASVHALLRYRIWRKFYYERFVARKQKEMAWAMLSKVNESLRHVVFRGWKRLIAKRRAATSRMAAVNMFELDVNMRMRRHFFKEWCHNASKTHRERVAIREKQRAAVATFWKEVSFQKFLVDYFRHWIDFSVLHKKSRRARNVCTTLTFKTQRSGLRSSFAVWRSIVKVRRKVDSIVTAEAEAHLVLVEEEGEAFRAVEQQWEGGVADAVLSNVVHQEAAARDFIAENSAESHEQYCRARAEGVRDYERWMIEEGGDRGEWIHRHLLTLHEQEEFDRSCLLESEEPLIFQHLMDSFLTHQAEHLERSVVTITENHLATETYGEFLMGLQDLCRAENEFCEAWAFKQIVHLDQLEDVARLEVTQAEVHDFISHVIPQRHTLLRVQTQSALEQQHENARQEVLVEEERHWQTLFEKLESEHPEKKQKVAAAPVNNINDEEEDKRRMAVDHQPAVLEQEDASPPPRVEEGRAAQIVQVETSEREARGVNVNDERVERQQLQDEDHEGTIPVLGVMEGPDPESQTKTIEESIGQGQEDEGDSNKILSRSPTPEKPAHRSADRNEDKVGSDDKSSQARVVAEDIVRGPRDSPAPTEDDVALKDFSKASDVQGEGAQPDPAHLEQAAGLEASEGEARTAVDRTEGRERSAHSQSVSEVNAAARDMSLVRQGLEALEEEGRGAVSSKEVATRKDMRDQRVTDMGSIVQKGQETADAQEKAAHDQKEKFCQERMSLEAHESEKRKALDDDEEGAAVKYLVEGNQREGKAIQDKEQAAQAEATQREEARALEAAQGMEREALMAQQQANVNQQALLSQEQAEETARSSILTHELEEACTLGEAEADDRKLCVATTVMNEFGTSRAVVDGEAADELLNLLQQEGAARGRHQHIQVLASWEADEARARAAIEFEQELLTIEDVLLPATHQATGLREGVERLAMVLLGVEEVSAQSFSQWGNLLLDEAHLVVSELGARCLVYHDEEFASSSILQSATERSNSLALVKEEHHARSDLVSVERADWSNVAVSVYTDFVLEVRHPLAWGTVVTQGTEELNKTQQEFLVELEHVQREATCEAPEQPEFAALEAQFTKLMALRSLEDAESTDRVACQHDEDAHFTLELQLPIHEEAQGIDLRMLEQTEWMEDVKIPHCIVSEDSIRRSVQRDEHVESSSSMCAIVIAEEDRHFSANLLHPFHKEMTALIVQRQVQALEADETDLRAGLCRQQQEEWSTDLEAPAGELIQQQAVLSLEAASRAEVSLEEDRAINVVALVRFESFEEGPARSEVQQAQHVFFDRLLAAHDVSVQLACHEELDEILRGNIEAERNRQFNRMQSDLRTLSFLGSTSLFKIGSRKGPCVISCSSADSSSAQVLASPFEGSCRQLWKVRPVFYEAPDPDESINLPLMSDSRRTLPGDEIDFGDTTEYLEESQQYRVWYRLEPQMMVPKTAGAGGNPLLDSSPSLESLDTCMGSGAISSNVAPAPMIHRKVTALLAEKFKAPCALSDVDLEESPTPGQSFTKSETRTYNDKTELDSTLWIFEPQRAGGCFVLMNQKSGMLQVPFGEVLEEGSSLFAAPKKENREPLLEQQFTFSVAGLCNATYEILLGRNHKQAVTSQGGFGPRSGTGIVLWAKAHAPNQRWKVELHSTGCVTIRSVNRTGSQAPLEGKARQFYLGSHGNGQCILYEVAQTANGPGVGILKPAGGKRSPSSSPPVGSISPPQRKTASLSPARPAPNQEGGETTTVTDFRLLWELEWVAGNSTFILRNHQDPTTALHAAGSSGSAVDTEELNSASLVDNFTFSFRCVDNESLRTEEVAVTRQASAHLTPTNRRTVKRMGLPSMGAKQQSVDSLEESNQSVSSSDVQSTPPLSRGASATDVVRGSSSRNRRVQIVPAGKTQPSPATPTSSPRNATPTKSGAVGFTASSQRKINGSAAHAISMLTSGRYVVQSKLDPSLCLGCLTVENEGQIVYGALGAMTVLPQPDEDPDSPMYDVPVMPERFQQFSVDVRPDGYCMIRPFGVRNLCFENPGMRKAIRLTASGDNVLGQLWKPEAQGSTAFVLISRKDGTALQIQGTSAGSGGGGVYSVDVGSKLVAWPDKHKGLNQQFQFVSIHSTTGMGAEGFLRKTKTNVQESSSRGTSSSVVQFSADILDNAQSQDYDWLSEKEAAYMRRRLKSLLGSAERNLHARYMRWWIDPVGSKRAEAISARSRRRVADLKTDEHAVEVQLIQKTIDRTRRKLFLRKWIRHTLGKMQTKAQQARLVVQLHEWRSNMLRRIYFGKWALHLVDAMDASWAASYSRSPPPGQLEGMPTFHQEPYDGIPYAVKVPGTEDEFEVSSSVPSSSVPDTRPLGQHVSNMENSNNRSSGPTSGQRYSAKNEAPTHTQRIAVAGGGSHGAPLDSPHTQRIAVAGGNNAMNRGGRPSSPLEGTSKGGDSSEEMNLSPLSRPKSRYARRILEDEANASRTLPLSRTPRSDSWMTPEQSNSFTARQAEGDSTQRLEQSHHSFSRRQISNHNMNTFVSGGEDGSRQRDAPSFVNDHQGGSPVRTVKSLHLQRLIDEGVVGADGKRKQQW